MIEIRTNNPVAYDSPDHIQPWGTANDNYTSVEFINEIEDFFIKNKKDKIKFLDLGCSGGQLVIDFLNRGHFSVGLEGSDYSARIGRANWGDYYNKNLFTCDITKPYSVHENDKTILFDLITAWEVVEHISTEDLYNFFNLINKNLSYEGIFLASIATHEDVVNGVRLHQSVFPKTEWIENIIPKIIEEMDLSLEVYPLNNYVRGGSESFHIMLKKIKK